MRIGIIGNGFVGKATTVLANNNVSLIVYDKIPELCYPLGTTIEDLKSCDLIFISVPTPMYENGKCCIKIVESVVSELYEKKIVNEPDNFIVIRSTVLPGTSDSLKCYFMPEFLTEKNYLEDFRTCREWIFGLRNKEYDNVFMNKINYLFRESKKSNCIVSDTTRFVKNSEAEMIKYFRNCYLALKVSFCNELYDYCSNRDIDYETVRNIATNDTRIGGSHTKVPGHDGSRGYGGTCFPKDTKALLNSMKDNNVNCPILCAVDYRNDNIDRKEHDWLDNIGRSVM